MAVAGGEGGYAREHRVHSKQFGFWPLAIGPLAVFESGWEETEPPQNRIDYVSGFRHRLYAAIELAKAKLALVQKRMKRNYDQ